MTICSVEGCGRKHAAKGYCKLHWAQIKRRGGIPFRTRLDPNEIFYSENHALIVLYDTYGNEKARTKVDLENVNLVKKFKWYLSNTGYAITRINPQKQLFLHRLLMNAPEHLSVDHINGDTLDNRCINLRLCTHRQNICNQKIRIDNTSGIRGVSWDNRKGKWRARIHVNGREKYLGCFSDYEEAVKARLDAEKKYFGEYTREFKNSPKRGVVI